MKLSVANRKLWRFCSPILMFTMGILFLFAVKLESWLQLPLGIIAIAVSLESIVTSLKVIRSRVRLIHDTWIEILND